MADHATLQVVVSGVYSTNSTGFNASWSVGAKLEGSLDGEDWYPLTADATVGAPLDASTSISDGGGVGVVSTTEPSTLFRFIRANFDTLESGGGGAGTLSISATLSAWVGVLADVEVPE